MGLKSQISGLIKYLHYRFLEIKYNFGNFSKEKSDYEKGKIESSKDHLLIIVLDCFRPDHFPDIGVDFEYAVAPAPWTFPSVTSTNTSLYPHEHGSVAHTMPDDEEYAMPKQAEDVDTLPEFMASHGYSTGLFVDFLMPFLPLKGWYQKHKIRKNSSKKLIQDYLNWREGKDKTFSYLHLGDLHEPLQPPKEYIQARDVDTSIEKLPKWKYTDNYDEDKQECREYRENRLKLYQASLDYLEDQLNDLLDQISDDTLIVITGDHGEAMWEHPEVDKQFTDSRPNYGVGHGGTPFDEVSRVPLAILDQSEQVKIDSDGWPSLIDIPKTLANRVAENEVFNGIDLVEEDIPKERPVFCEGVRYGKERKAVYKGERKVINSEEDDLMLPVKIDTEEPGDRFVDNSELDFSDLLHDLPGDVEDNSEGVDEMVKKRLKDLGYN